MYFYVSCRPDIGYDATIPSKISFNTSNYHYNFPKNLARYLRITREWGIRYKRRGPQMDLPEPKCHLIVWDKNIPTPKQGFDKGELMCFVDASYVNETNKSKSNTGFILHFTMVQLFTGLKPNISMR